LLEQALLEEKKKKKKRKEKKREEKKRGLPNIYNWKISFCTCLLVPASTASL